MPSFDIQCPHCQAVLEATEDFYGETVECPECDGDIHIAAPQQAPAVVTAPMQSAPKPSKINGALIGAMICFGIGLLLMFWSLFAFLFYSPLFLAAFALSIVAIAQKRIAIGVLMLILTIVIPPVLGIGLAAFRSADTLEAFSGEMNTAINEMQTEMDAAYSEMQTEMDKAFDATD